MFQRPTLQKIIEATAQEFSQTTEFIVMPKKGRGHKNIPGKIAMFIAKNIWDYRLKEIAKAFGLIHYGAVANAIFILPTQLIENPEFELKLKAIIKRLDP